MIKRPDVVHSAPRRPITAWLAIGAAVAALSACDEAKTRADKLGKLAGCAQAQLSGKSAADCPSGSAADNAAASAASALAEAPLAARAIAGVQQAPVTEVQTASLEERIRTESFFAIGSVIAKPKEQLSEPAVDPASFNVDAVNAPAAAAPAPPTTSPAPPPPAAVIAPTQPTTPGGASPNRDLRIKPIPMIKALPKSAVRDRLKIDPGALERATREATKDSGIKVTQETVKEAQQMARQKIEVNSRTAQSVGDEIIRRGRDAAKPVPRALAVRSQLNVDRSIIARDRAFQRLEKLGLSGAVTPEEGGTIRITIGVSPTKLGDKIDPTKIASMRALFAADKVKPGQDCATTPDAAKIQTDLVLATECAVKELKESGDYEYVEKDYIFTNQMLRRPKSTPPLTNSGITPQPAKPGATPGPVSVTPNDPLFSLQWDFKELGTAVGQSPGGAGFGNFWTRAKVTGSKSVTVAIVDTGLQMSHPDIKNSPHIAPGFDMISDPLIANDGDGPDADANDPGDKCDLMDPDEEDSFHGTHVAGTIGAGFTNNGAGVAGGAWDVTIVPVRALGRCGGRLSDINAGIRWAAGVIAARDAAGNQVWNAHPADIINLSIGLFQPCPESMQQAIDDAVAAGAIVVVAAGNDRVDTKNYAPGGCKNVISVAAGDGRGYIAPYSNFGANVAMLAPGGDMTRDDDHDGRPDGILSTKLSKNCYDPVTKANVAECYYSYEQGTSMAAPHVTAALALLKSKFPAAVPSKLQEMLMTSTSSREPLQCSGKCSDYPGTTAIPGQPGMCTRACGGRILNLSNAPLQ